MAPLSWPVLTLSRLTRSCADTSWRITIPVRSSPTSKPATSARPSRSAAWFQKVRTRYSVLPVLLTGLAALLRSAEPLSKHAKNNQTTYEKEDHNETKPNFKLSQAALHLRTYCLRTPPCRSRRRDSR